MDIDFHGKYMYKFDSKELNLITACLQIRFISAGLKPVLSYKINHCFGDPGLRLLGFNIIFFYILSAENCL